MGGILVPQKVSKAIASKFPTTLTSDEKKKYDELAYTFIILHHYDILWEKLVNVILHKSLGRKWSIFICKNLLQTYFFYLKVFQF